DGCLEPESGRTLAGVGETNPTRSARRECGPDRRAGVGIRRDGPIAAGHHCGDGGFVRPRGVDFYLRLQRNGPAVESHVLFAGWIGVYDGVYHLRGRTSLRSDVYLCAVSVR